MDISEKVKAKIAAGREYRKVADAFSPIEGNPDERIVEGYASTFNDPYILYREDDYTVREQVDQNAFAETDMSDTIMQYDHEGRVFARVSNETLKIGIDPHGLRIRADLGGTVIGRQLYEEIKGGYTNKMSFGFTVLEDKWEETNTEDGKTDILRTITKVGKLYDVSAVSLPANDATEISARNLSEGAIEKVRKEQAEAKAKADEIERKKKLIAIEMEVL